MARTPNAEQKKATELANVIKSAVASGQITGSAVGRGGESFQLVLGDRMRISAIRKSKGAFDLWWVSVERRGVDGKTPWVADGAPLRGKPAREVFTALQDMHRARQTAELRNAADSGPAGPGD